jgi:hypothetical protein
MIDQSDKINYFRAMPVKKAKSNSIYIDSKFLIIIKIRHSKFADYFKVVILTR